jgi:hypothetical protein
VSLLSRQLLFIASIAATTVCAATGQAAESVIPASTKASKYVVPKTEFGQPDLRGVWNFSSDTPLERPAQYKDRAFITPEEFASRHQQIQDRADANEKNGRGLNNSPVGGYNEFWVESLAQGANLRTSLLIDPPDGRLPKLQPGVKNEAGGLDPTRAANVPCAFVWAALAKMGQRIAAYPSVALWALTQVHRSCPVSTTTTYKFSKPKTQRSS